MSAPSGGGGRSGTSTTSSTLTAWRSVRFTGVSPEKLQSKKPNVAEVRVAQQVLRRAHRRVGHVEAFEDDDPLRRRARGQGGGEDLVQLVDAAAALGGIPEPGELGHLGTADLVQDLGPVALRVGQHADPAVLGLVRPPPRREHAHVADLAALLEGRRAHVLGEAERGHQLEHRHLDIAWHLAGALAIEEGCHDRVGEVDARHLVGGDAGRIERRPVAHLEQAGEARRRLDHVVVGRLAGIAPVPAEADRRRVDDARVGLAHGIEGEAQPVHRLLAHVVHEHVGSRDELSQRRLAGLGLQVEHDGAFVAVEVGEDGREAGRRQRGNGAHAVALRRLDLDHLGAEIAQDLRAIGPQDYSSKIQDAQTFEERDHTGPLWVELWLKSRYTARAGPPTSGFGFQGPGADAPEI